nr:MAG TPA: hypothetical protein [Caudoviricetes sp.]
MIASSSGFISAPIWVTGVNAEKSLYLSPALSTTQLTTSVPMCRASLNLYLVKCCARLAYNLPLRHEHLQQLPLRHHRQGLPRLQALRGRRPAGCLQPDPLDPCLLHRVRLAPGSDVLQAVPVLWSQPLPEQALITRHTLTPVQLTQTTRS